MEGVIDLSSEGLSKFVNLPTASGGDWLASSLKKGDWTVKLLDAASRENATIAVEMRRKPSPKLLRTIRKWHRLQEKLQQNYNKHKKNPPPGGAEGFF